MQRYLIVCEIQIWETSASNPSKQVHNLINKVKGPTVTAGAVGKVGKVASE
jgi:hypothetical protein